jgi:hypothetical protein
VISKTCVDLPVACPGHQVVAESNIGYFGLLLCLSRTSISSPLSFLFILPPVVHPLYPPHIALGDPSQVPHR